jgi:fibronectin type 3 domain-containing protein
MVLALVVCLILTTGCAKIGEPQPPEVRIPRAAVDLAAQQLADTILLKVTKPTENTDGSAATTLASVDVYRLLGNPSAVLAAAALRDDEYADRAERILSIPSSRLADYVRGDSLCIQDKLDIEDRSRIYSQTLQYAVLFVSQKNQAAGFSNKVSIAPVAIPPAPSGLSAVLEENCIRLKWNAPLENMDGSKPPRIAGYKIFKAEGSAEFPPEPIQADLVQGTVFEDRSFEFGKTYRYVIRTVGSAQNPYAESLPSEILSVETRDTFPPSPPENFHAIRQEGSIILLWAPSSSPDVAGYRIYRQDKTSAARVLLQKELITVFNHRDVQPEGHGSYAIQAIDTHGNESALVEAEAEAR